MRFFLILALNMQTTVIVYWVYTLTNDVASVGMLGLFEAIPAIGFSFISGHIVDQKEKRNLILICIIAYLLLSIFYITLSLQGHLHNASNDTIVHLVYAGIFIGGMLRAFISPAGFALQGMLIPRKLYPNASTWSSTAWQTGAVVGPLAGGLLIAFAGIAISLSTALSLLAVALVGILLIPRQAIMKKEKEPILQSLREGARFVFRTQIILAVLALDMFAVLFGGATALLPAYARDILKVGEVGFGWLRAAPGIGAIAMFFILANKPLKTNPGPKLFVCIACFGATLIIFGISKVFALSMAMLILSGAFDAVSVVIRSTILQLYTPDDMRGRVAALNTMFISSSNELGEVESGFTAKWMGTVPAVVFGGCMTMLVVGVTYLTAPKLKALKLEIPDKGVN
jgi:MFS family permease